MKRKFLALLVALCATTALWASNTITYSATNKLKETTEEWSAGLHTNAFNVAIMSHEFAKGTGTIIFSDELTTIGKEAFYECSGLTSVTIPNSVTTIGDYAFYDCSSLTSITIPNSVTTIGGGAFQECSSLISATIGNSVTRIEVSAFYDCTSLTSVTIGNSVTEIGWSAFEKCSALTSITIPNSVTTIGDEAFMDCRKLTSINIPNSVKTIGEYAFYDCSGLTSITIGNSVTTIGKEAFNNCSNLTSVTIGNSVKTIGEYAFFGCYRLTSVTIPNSVTTIGYKAFSSNLKSVYVVLNDPFKVDYSHVITKNFDSSILSNKVQCVEVFCITPTCATVTIDLTNIDVSKYAKMCLNYKEQEYALQAGVNTILLTGMYPNTVNDLVFYSQLLNATNWIEGATIEVIPPALEFTTLTPKVVSAGTAIVAASTNISDYETNVGFEWRKDNAPEGSASKSGAAIICNGVMEGRLLNLGTDWWKARPYYEAADGTRYYGDWAYIDPTDASYFEPTVHTYAMPTSPTGNQVQVRGYVMTGTDEVTEQGFEYWFNSDPKAPSRIPAATSDSIYRVTASGQVMTAVLKDLAYSTTYTCRAYAVADGKTYYGEEVQFLTPEDPRPIYTLTLDAGIGGQVNTEAAGQYREGEQVTLRATADKGYVFVQWSDLNTENPRTITMTSDITLSAIFEESQPQEVKNVIECDQNNVNKFLRNGQVIIRQGNKEYDAVGREMK